MNFEGFLRSLQGDFLTVAGVLFTIGIFYALARIALKYSTDDDSMRDVRKMVNIAACVLVTLVLVFFAGRAVTVSYTNRMPRSDVDKSSVYEQMSEHTTDGNDRLHK